MGDFTFESRADLLRVLKDNLEGFEPGTVDIERAMLFASADKSPCSLQKSGEHIFWWSFCCLL